MNELKRMSRSEWVRFMTVVMGAIVLFLHFAGTIIYLNPLSGPGLKLRGTIARYMEPFLKQRWSLFAPDPPVSDMRLEFRCETGGVAGPWQTKSDALMRTHSTWRLTPAGRLRRLEVAAASAALGVRDEVVSKLSSSIDKAPAGARRAIEELFAAQAAQRLEGSMLGYRLAMHYCETLVGDEVERVAFRIVTSSIRPFSKRFDDAWTPNERAFEAPLRTSTQVENIPEEAKDLHNALLEKIAQGETLMEVSSGVIAD